MQNRFFQLVEIDEPPMWAAEGIQCEVTELVPWNGGENFVFLGNRGVLRQILETYLNGDLRFKTQSRDLLVWALGDLDGNPASLKKWKRAKAAAIPNAQTKCAAVGA